MAGHPQALADLRALLESHVRIEQVARQQLEIEGMGGEPAGPRFLA